MGCDAMPVMGAFGAVGALVKEKEDTGAEVGPSAFLCVCFAPK